VKRKKSLTSNKNLVEIKPSQGKESIKTPVKKSKKQELTQQQKSKNKELATDANFCGTLNSEA
jgi:hypothetical protein